MEVKGGLLTWSGQGRAKHLNSLTLRLELERPASGPPPLASWLRLSWLSLMPCPPLPDPPSLSLNLLLLDLGSIWNNGWKKMEGLSTLGLVLLLWGISISDPQLKPFGVSQITEGAPP